MKKINHVNTTIGSFNEPKFSNGNLYPITALPFGMAHFTLQTNENNNWFYNPLSHSLDGIRLTHQPSPWVGDYGHILITPFAGEFSKNRWNRWSSYRPNQTILKPNKIEVYFQRYRVNTTFTPTERGGCFTFKNSGNSNIGVAISTYANSNFQISNNIVFGYTDSQSLWKFKRVREYFYITFSSKIISYETLENGGVSLHFDSDCVEMKLATSFISEKQAKLNHHRELESFSFTEIMQKGEDLWEEYLNSIVVSEENLERVKTFYSCMYRAFLYPRIFHEYNESGNPIHFNVDTQKVENGLFFTDNGFWDTFRTVYPLLSIIKPNLVRDMVEGFINYSEETGWLPKWISPGEIGMMPGALVESVIADACIKGIIDDKLRSKAYKSMKKNAFEVGTEKHGRQGISDYIKYNYVPNNYKESINHTCDSAYGDFCIAQIAEMEKDFETAKILNARSKNYINLFDKESRFLRSKDKYGNFKEPFNPYRWGDDNCEGSSWQNSFAVYHDIEGLVSLYGGKDNFENRLDELFNALPIYEVGGYEQEIHEMSEMACVDFGQMAISNQPSFHIPWLYTVIGKREKTIYWINKLANEAFSSSIDGFPGDEDNGTTACWYIFACLGFYPVCPCGKEFVSSKPLFNKIFINGKELKQNLPDIVLFNELF